MTDQAPHYDPHHVQAAKKAAAIEAWMLPLFKKAPHLPPNIRQTLVDIVPWIALIGGILGVVGILSASTFTSMVFTFSFLRFGMFPMLYTVGMLIGLAAAVLNLAAYQPLTQFKKAGWNYLFYGMLLGVVSFAFSFVAGYAHLGQLAGLVIGFWLLFEIRDAYKA